jgi:hypothetical protein
MAKEYEGDYEFGQASQFDLVERDLASRVQTETLKSIALAFQVNIHRVRSMNALPIELIHWSGFASRAYCAARVNAGLAPTDESRDQWPELNLALQTVMRTMLADRQKASEQNHANRNWADGTRFLKRFLRPSIEAKDIRPGTLDDMLTSGTEAILASMVTIAYASLETLCTDLWIEAVNSSTKLAANWIRKNPKKEIKLEDLAGHDFNMSSAMGTALYQMGKAKFNSLNDITSCFKDAFDGAVDSSFEPRQGLFEAEKIRHLLAHRGGLIDPKFNKEMEQYPEYASQPIGSRLKLSGPLVCRNANACVRAGTSLMENVDLWLVNNA